MANDVVRKVVGQLILKLLILSALAYVGFCVLIYVLQDRLLFFPTRDMERTPAANGWSYEEVRLPVDDHETFGWYVPAPEQSRGVVLFSHGNAGNISHRLESIGLWRALNFDVLAYDYGGYSLSTGRASEARCYADIRAMYQWLREEKSIPAEQIVLFGRSLGAGPTLQLAIESPCAAVVIESTFRSVPQMGSEIYPWLPVKLLARARFDNESKIASVNVPILVAHSPDDTIIPYTHGRALFDAAKAPKAFLEFRGDHNEGFWISGNTYTEGLDEFLRKHLDR